MHGWKEGEKILNSENERVRADLEKIQQEAIYSPEFKEWFGDWETTYEAEVEIPSRISQWLSRENLERAQGKSREEIIKEFGNSPKAIAYIPIKFLPLIDINLTDNRVYSGMGYFIDHAVNHHPSIETEKYLNIQTVLNNPDEVKSIPASSKSGNSIAFIKQIDRYNAVVIEVEKTSDNRIVWHKSFYDQNKKPYANKGVQLYGISSGGGVSPIIRTNELAHDGSLSVLDDDAKVRKNLDSTKYPRYISQIPHQWSNCCQIRDSQRVISLKNRYFRSFLACFGRSPL